MRYSLRVAVLSSAGVVLALAVCVAGCGGPARPAASKQPAATPSPSVSPSPQPTASPMPLIRDTRADRAACRMFLREQTGQISPDQFNVWLLEPQHGNPVSNKLGTALADWFVNLNMNPSQADNYANQAESYCGSINIIF
jgi:hypothetical protein